MEEISFVMLKSNSTNCYSVASTPVAPCFTFWTCWVDNMSTGLKVNPIKQTLKLWKVSGPLQSIQDIGDTYPHMDRKPTKDHSEMKKVFRDSAFVFSHSHFSTGEQPFCLYGVIILKIILQSLTYSQGNCHPTADAAPPAGLVLNYLMTIDCPATFFDKTPTSTPICNY